MQRILVELGDSDDIAAIGPPMIVATTVRGALGDDRMAGRPGPDRLVGGRGTDTARGGDGNDTLDMKNGDRDVRVDCGAGNDVAMVDRKDPRARILRSESGAEPPATAEAPKETPALWAARWSRDLPRASAEQ